MKSPFLILSITTLILFISSGCKKPVGDSTVEPNKYLFRDTISPIHEDPPYYPALNIGYGPGPIPNTFSYDLWVKPTRNIIMVDESNACSDDGTSSLANSDQNWVIIPRLFTSPDFGTGLSVGTNGLIVAEFSTVSDFTTALLISRLSYSVPITNWVHVALVYRTDSLFLFLNGNLVKKKQISCNSGTKYSSTVLTGRLLSPDFLGDIDEFRLWDIALTSRDVNIIMDKKLTEQVTGLRYYISFDNGTFKRTLGDIGEVTMIATAITPERNIKTSSWNLDKYKGKTISTLTPY